MCCREVDCDFVSYDEGGIWFSGVNWQYSNLDLTVLDLLSYLFLLRVEDLLDGSPQEFQIISFYQQMGRVG